MGEVLDVAVVGAGQAGLAVGYHLRRTGLSFALLDEQEAPGGAWRLATDWDDYAEAMRAVLDAHDGFRLVSTERARMRPVTRFERKGVARGRRITDLAYAAR